MMLFRLSGILGLLLHASLLFASPVISISAEDDLQHWLDTAPENSTLELSAGIYRGNFELKRSIHLKGQAGTVIDADGKNDALRVKAENVRISGIAIRNWGDDLTAMNAGIFVESSARNIIIENNALQGDTTGIWLERCDNASVLNNRIQGNNAMRITDRGNGIHLSNTTNSEIRGNEVWHTRDGLYIISSQHNTLADNDLHDLRYGVHYMYSHSNTVTSNRTSKTRAGFALMQSRLLTVTDNRATDNEDYGILMNFITHSTIQNNRIDGVRQSTDEDVDGADGKGLFIYNSVGNQLLDNVIQGAEIGIHLTAGSEGNTIAGNSFVFNQTQVKYVSSRTQEWSRNGRGNYWSNYLGWDMNNDAIGDNVFEPNDGIDKLLWKFPQAKVLMDSPGILLLRFVQRQFPVLKSPGVRDSFPLMKQPPGHELTRMKTQQISAAL